MSPARLVLALLASLVLAVPAPAADGAPARDELVRADPPWYDAGKDAWKRVDPGGIEMPELPEFSMKGGSLDVPGFSAGLVAWILVAVLAAALAILLIRFWPRNRDTANGGGPRRIAAGAVAWTGLGEDAGDLDPEAGLAAAIAAGDWRRAVAWAYVRMLVRLDHAGVLHLEPGDTAHGVLRAVAAWARAGRTRGDVPRALATATATLETVCWARLPAGRSHLDQILAADHRLTAVLTAEEAKA